MIAINIINLSSNPNPVKATEGSSGYDLQTSIGDLTVEQLEARLGSDFEVDIDEETNKPFILLESGGRYLFPTGLFMNICKNFEGQVRPRSGLAIKKGLTVLNTPGTIDSDYRGEIGVILINQSKNQVRIDHGDKIAQLVIGYVEEAEWIDSGYLDNTTRGDGGFGHSDIQSNTQGV